MATASLPELTPEQQQAAVILARLAAQKAVKRQRQRQGIKGSLPNSVWSPPGDRAPRSKSPLTGRGCG
jgi:hypothetical protein